MRLGFRLTPAGPVRALLKLGATCLGLLLAVVASDRLLGAVIENDASWRTSQDPRQRVLWDSQYDGSPVVLIGDSEFCSFYVDAPGETLWDRLSVRSGKRVFPASLDGARPIDIMLIARRVAALWPSGTTAFIGITSTRIFRPRTTSLPRASNYSPQFRLLVNHAFANEGWLPRIERRLAFDLAGRSFLIRNQEWVLRYLRALLTGGPDRFSSDETRIRTWNIDGDFALRRFRRFEAALAADSVDQLVSFNWIRSLEEVLSERGIRPVFVLLPLNVALVNQYSDKKVPTEQILTSSHDYLVRELLASGFNFVDLFRELNSASFADVNHTNTRGDDAIAGALNDWLRGRRLAHDPGVQDLGVH
jgi:hypothetical protein